jgi:hypothetical protein
MTYSNALIALAASYNGTSYSLPSYIVYPGDNFFGKIQSIPFNISTVQTNTLAAVNQCAKVYSPYIYVYSGVDSITSPTTANLYAATSIGSSNAGSRAVKSNPVTDPCTGEVYWSYSVDNYISTLSTDVSGYLHMFSMDLKTTPGYTTTAIANVSLDCCDISGHLIIDGYFSYGTSFADPTGTYLATISEGYDGNDVALSTFSTTTELTAGDAGTVQYLISGNRIWFAVSGDANQLTSAVHVVLQFRVIETPNPTSLSALSAAVLASALSY